MSIRVKIIIIINIWVFFSLTFFCFDVQVCNVLNMYSQRVYMYLLKVLREQALSRGQLHTVFLALIISRLRYSLPAWSGFLSREQIVQINAFLKIIYRCGFSCELIQLETLTSAADNRLFAKMCGQVHCIHSLLPPATNYSLKHRPF